MCEKIRCDKEVRGSVNRRALCAHSGRNCASVEVGPCLPLSVEAPDKKSELAMSCNHVFSRFTLVAAAYIDRKNGTLTIQLTSAAG